MQPLLYTVTSRHLSFIRIQHPILLATTTIIRSRPFQEPFAIRPLDVRPSSSIAETPVTNRKASSCLHRKPPPTKTMAPDMTTLKGKPLVRSELDNVLRRCLFITPSFELYGGVAGFWDYGPPGCALNANILDLWRNHFVKEENMLELDCPIITPEVVLQTSGHVERFSGETSIDQESQRLNFT
jgi:hypothetical protein